MRQSISFYGFVVKPGTFASAPFEAAEHAEFGCTTTGHVVAAFLELNKGSAAVAALPSCFSCSFEKRVRFGVLRTVPRTVPFCITCTTDFGLTFSADTSLFTVNALDILRPNPFPTFLRRTVDTVFSGVFFIFAIPLLLPPIRKQLVYSTKRDGVGSTTFRWHLLRIGEREFETPTQAGVALTVPAFELFGAGGFYFVVEADYAHDTRSMLALKLARMS